MGTDVDAVTIQRGALGADYVKLRSVSSLTPEWLRTKGCTFVCRYVKKTGSLEKEITADEITELHAQGIAIVLNYEGGKMDADGGDEAGRLHAREAADAARALGYPEGLSIIVSVDNEVESTDSVKSLKSGSEVEHEKAFAYVSGFATAIRTFGYAPGVYGDALVLSRCAAPDMVAWLSGSTGWSASTKGEVVHIRQHAQNDEDKIDHIDRNECVTEFRAWLPDTAAVGREPDPTGASAAVAQNPYPGYPGKGEAGAPEEVVKAWQDLYITKHLILDTHDNRDGVWGEGMTKATKKLQRSWGWGDADGVAGEHTYCHLTISPCPQCGQST